MTDTPRPARIPRKAAAKPATALSRPINAPAPRAPEQEDIRMTDTIRNVADQAQDTAKTAFAKASEGAKDVMDKGKQAVSDAAEFHKGNIEALVESGRIAASGFQSIAQARAAYAKQSFDATAATMKSLAQAGSPTEFFKIQGDYLRSSMDSLVGEMSRSTEQTLKLAGEVAQPIGNRVALAMEKAKVAA